jgi:molybdenum cofactor guanylyltransferase
VSLERPYAGFAAVVLAGGRSSRMGSPKALLDWHGTPLLRRVVGILQRVADPVVVVHAAGQELPPLPPGVELRIDANPGRGPLEGIAAGMRALDGRAEVAFVSSTDVPLLHPAFVRSVAAAVDGNDAALPVADGHNHPLAAAYRLSLLPQVERLLAEDRLRPAFLFEAARVRRLEVDELEQPGSLRNLNTLEDYRAALAEPLPLISVEAFGPLRRTLGFTRTSVPAASLGAVLEALPAVVEHLDHVLVALNGEHFQVDREVPLVHGDTLALVTAEAGG